MQDSLERQGIQFVPSDGEGPAVRLRPSVWRLNPIDPDSLNWKASIYCGELIIRAPSERRARQIAGLALSIAVRRIPGQRVISNPWNRLVGEATCERLVGSKHEDKGQDAILFPEKYDGEWKR